MIRTAIAAAAAIAFAIAAGHVATKAIANAAHDAARFGELEHGY